MKQVSAILLLLIYLSAATELHQLVRLPVFIAHYQEHKKLNAATNLADFIVLHYFSGDLRDDDYERDQQLPFKSNDCVEVALSLVILPDNPFQPPAKVELSLSKPVQYNTSSFLSRAQLAIWQPPKA